MVLMVMLSAAAVVPQTLASCGITETNIRPLIFTVDAYPGVSPVSLAMFNIHGDFSRFNKGTTTSLYNVFNSAFSSSESIITAFQTTTNVVTVTNLKFHIYLLTTGAYVRSVAHGFPSLTSVINRRAVELTSGLIVFATTNSLYVSNIATDTFSVITNAQTTGIRQLKGNAGVVYYLMTPNKLMSFDGVTSTQLIDYTAGGTVLDFDFNLLNTKALLLIADKFVLYNMVGWGFLVTQTITTTTDQLVSFLDTRITLLPSNWVYSFTNAGNVITLMTDEHLKSSWACSTQNYIRDTASLFLFCMGRGLLAEMSASNSLQFVYDSGVDSGWREVIGGINAELRFGSGFYRLYHGTTSKIYSALRGVR
jgi:hypothetical protein